MMIPAYTVYWDSPTGEREKIGKKYKTKQYSRHFHSENASAEARLFCIRMKDHNPVVKETTISIHCPE